MEPNENENRDTRRYTYEYNTKPKRRGAGVWILWALIFALLGGVAGGFVTYRMMDTPRVSEGIMASPAQGKQEKNVKKQDRDHQAGIVESVAEAAMPSVVGITTSMTQNTPMGPMAVEGSGSGFVIAEDGYILSNAHVVGAADNTVKVLFNDGSETEGKVVWSDTTMDLGLVKVDRTGLSPLKMGDSDSINIGEIAVAIGNPLGLDFQRSVTAGVISGLNRSIGEVQGNYMDGLIQTDASINQGNSGGPLLNSEGEVVGINSVKIATAEGLGFSIPVNTAKPIIEQVIKTGDFRSVSVGIGGYSVSAVERSGYDLGTDGKGVLVGGVQADSPAAAAGLQVNDIILKMGDREIESMAQLRSELYKYKPGDAVKLTLMRDGKELVVDLTFTDYQAPQAPTENSRKRRGFFPPLG
ncbi:S1-C subfamily serine protease [Peptoniphilus ivorii]|uniref:S1C family serine protease n=1 Tax=Aedoeadaptatus ivorii TaxID=54006 RepID=UPI00278B410F|nr:trypsin-like peptidase domain-containing protein [Peptoniphilus ivorii]MDQ0508321.1 S1-C subfamily serine protease [Peptoniphilus ivorii]